MTADGLGEEGFFGERVAAHYDERSAAMSEPAVVEPVVDLLAGFAGGGGALEFGIGTGRIALPLGRRGVRVAGIDSSEPMLSRLRAKPGAEEIEAVHGDFSSARVAGRFSLVYLVFNTIFNLVTQDAQVACFANAAAHLRRGGRLVIETGVPDLQSLPLGHTVVPFAPTPTASPSTCTTSSPSASAPSTSTWSTAGWRPSRWSSATPGPPSST